MTVSEVLLDRLRTVCGAERVGWVEHAMERAATGTRTQLLTIYTEASRQLASGSSGLAAADAANALPRPLSPFSLDLWSVEDAARLLFLLARHTAAPEAPGFFSDAAACYEEGDAREQLSWIRGVGLLPQPERYLPLVIDACRTNILPLFEAVACENPYPATHFPERNFNQLVLKALFNGVGLARIVHLETRLNVELSRMARDYADERRAAGRAVPADIGMAITPA